MAIGGEEFENTELPETEFSAQRAVKVVQELEACGVGGRFENSRGELARVLSLCDRD